MKYGEKITEAFLSKEANKTIEKNKKKTS